MKLFLLTLGIYIFYLFLKTKESLHRLQQNRYNRGNKYLKWIKENKKKNFLTAELIFIIFPIFTLIFPKSTYYLFIVFYLLISFLFLYKKAKEQTKIPLKWTGRIIRLFITTGILYGIMIFLFCFFYKENEKELYYSFLILLGYFNNFMVILSNILNTPIEKIINTYYKKKATNKLKQFTHLKVIGITGSYGKTSSKNILNDVLNVKYNATPSPKNYNTPFGLMITINDYLDKYNDFFIAEMGACKTKEIKELCNLVHPTYGILTKIGVAHLETFGSMENIQKTKFELIESLPKDGIGVLNADDPLQVNYNLKKNCSILWIGIKNIKKCDVYATDIHLSSKGTSFICHFKKKNVSFPITTKLLGTANIYNILAALALGDALGLTEEQLILGVKKVKPVEHRLELKNYYGMTLIDDAYNANPDGAKMALDVLNLMKGKKIVITSGMIELGEKSYTLNKELGEYMANCTDIAILVGENQTKPIQDGLLSKKFKKENIMITNDIMEAFTFLKSFKEENTYILLQSDLPDIFNE